MKTYRVVRSMTGKISVWVLGSGNKLQSLTHVVVNSPTGFETGYGGSGPGDLALAILINYFAEPLGPIPGADPHGRAYRLHQEFKADVIAAQQLAPGEHYDIDSAFIESWLGLKGETPWVEAIAGGVAFILAMLPWLLT